MRWTLNILGLLFALTTFADAQAPTPAAPVSPLETSLAGSPPASWDALLDAASLTELESLFTQRDNPPAWWGRAGLRLMLLYRHVGRPKAAERIGDLALKAQGPHQARVRALLKTLRVTASGRHIGVLAPLTGKYGSAGRAVVKAARLALEGTPYELVTFDTQGLENRAIGRGGLRSRQPASEAPWPQLRATRVPAFCSAALSSACCTRAW